MALIGMEVGLRDGTQVCVTVLTDKIKGSFLVISFGISLVSQILMLIGKIFRIPMDDITRIDEIIDGFIKAKKEND